MFWGDFSPDPLLHPNFDQILQHLGHMHEKSAI
jgi:hypothetical protein